MNVVAARGWRRLTPGSVPPPSEAQYSAPLQRDASAAARYEDECLLGKGGMGEVRLCLDHRTGREVAVKRISVTMRDERRRARFLREARIQAQLDHPTIVPVYDMGADETGLEYFTMKPAEGFTLAEILDELRLGTPEFCRQYPLPARLRILRQICHGVEYAHARGIVHRDLKPTNVIVGDLGQTYLLDWGIAKIVGPGSKERDASAGPTGALGTPGYMAPEQIDDADAVDVRADVYALGAMLFELLTLEPLHADEDMNDVIEATRAGLDERRIGIRKPGLDLPCELESLCFAATETDPNNRISSVSELLKPIDEYLDGDRDLSVRHSLAQTHADAAYASLRTFVAQGDTDNRLRIGALREAGHAIALNPHCEDAAQVLTYLLAKPPETLPKEVEEQLEEYEELEARESSRGLGAFYSLVVPLGLLLMLSVEVRNWPAALSIIVPLVFAAASVVLRNRGYAWAPSQEYTTYAGLCAVTATSTLGGPFLITPALLAGFVAVAASHVRVATRRPVRWAIVCLATGMTPMVLQGLGWLPFGMRIETTGRLTFQHQISDASSTTMYVTLLVALLMAILGPMLNAYRTARAVRALRIRLVVQIWHLRKFTSM